MKDLDCMINYLLIIFFIFLYGCSPNTKTFIWEKKINNKKLVNSSLNKSISISNIDFQQNYTFNQYVDILNNSKSEEFPDINKIPE